MRERIKVVYDNRKNKWSFWLLYTIIFAILFALVFLNFIFYDRSFINRIDGLEQQYNALLYFAKWAKQLMAESLASGRLIIPLWDTNIGMGADIISTLHYYVVGNPVNLLAIFVPYSLVDYVYSIAFAAALYFAGAAFACFSLYHRNGKMQTILGAMIYCFCGFVLQKGVQHTYFINPMIYLPLILLGIDKIYQKKNPTIFIVFTALCAFSNFYFFYMILFFIILYVGYRFFAREGKKNIKEAGLWVLRFLIYGIISIMIAAVVFLPAVYIVSGSDRVVTDIYVPLLYKARYYYELFFGFSTNEFREFDCRTGYAGIAVLAIALLFLNKGNRGLKICFLVLTAFLCIPYVGSALNGFGYVSNRWIFAYSLLISYIFVKSYPLFLKLNKRILRNLLIILAGYLGLSMLFPAWGKAEIFQAGLFLGLILIGMVINYIIESHKGMKVTIFLSVMLGILLLSYNEYSIYKRAAVQAYLPYENTYEQYGSRLVSNYLKEISDVDEYRSLCSGYGEEISNSYMQQGLHGIDFYFSMTDRHISQYLKEMYYNEAMEHSFQEFDNRMIMELLASVKYYLYNPNTVLPNDFIRENLNPVSNEEKNIMIYENPAALSFGYTYDAYIPRARYEKMSVTDKQEAMMYGVIMEESSHQEAWPVFENKEVDYEIIKTDKINIYSETVEVLEDGAGFDLLLEEIPANSECYVIVEGLEYEGISPKERYYSAEEWENLSRWNRKSFLVGEKGWVEPTQISLQISTSKLNKQIIYFTNKQRMYSGKKDFLCNMGQIEEEMQEIKITFANSGRYTWKDLRVVYQPLEGILKQADVLRETHISDIEFGTNYIKGNIDCDSPKILCMSIPYNDGWKAYVDGKESNMLCANTMYIGLELEAGNHEIEFRYVTPYIREGGWLSLVGLLILVGINGHYYWGKYCVDRK